MINESNEISIINFKVDENLPLEAKELLTKACYNTETVHGESLSGCTDEQLITICRKEQRILLTLDHDFADIRTYPPESLPGIIVLRIFEQSKENVLSSVERIILAMKTEKPDNKLWIVDEKRIRIRE